MSKTGHVGSNFPDIAHFHCDSNQGDTFQAIHQNKFESEIDIGYTAEKETWPNSQC